MASIDLDESKIQTLLTRGVENIYPSKGYLESALKSGKQLRIYFGIDPTGPNIHLGHAIPLQKMRQFQDLGHKIIMLIGSFTAMIGDPDKAAVRKQLTKDEVVENMKNYLDQASKIINTKNTDTFELRYNDEWLAKMNFEDVLNLASKMTVQQMLERDMFRKRLNFSVTCPKCETLNKAYDVEYENGFAKTILMGSGLVDKEFICVNEKCLFTINFKMINGFDPEHKAVLHSPKPVYIHEFMYPLMQGYDSIALDVDGEVGGNDQTFNMLTGRTLMKEIKDKEKFVLTTKLLVDPTGTKMGKSEGNMIILSDTPEAMFGKVMSWTDGMIVPGFELCTLIPQSEIDEISKSLEDTTYNPKQAKEKLAHTIVARYFDTATADKALEAFNSTFQKGEIPENIPEVSGPTTLVEAIKKSNLAESNSEIRRLVDSGAVTNMTTDEKVTDVHLSINTTTVFRIGKHRFIKITV